MRTKNIIMLMVSLIVVGGTMSFNLKKNKYALVIPKGWPKPYYEIGKTLNNEATFTLGRKLFYEPLLSRNATISCADCHTQYSAFTHVDHAVSHGIYGRKGNRNAPVLVNLAWNTSFMWDGGINNLEVQPLAPITHASEMDNTLDNIISTLDTLPKYKLKFYRVFGDSNITGQRILRSLAVFTAQFQSYNSKYDKYVRHEKGGEFTAQEINGLTLFRKHCISCHKEPLFTDFSFRNIGIPVDTEINDFGRIRITGKTEDSLLFKVPTLRNIEVSFPYMHDGRFKSLRQVLNHYTGRITKTVTLDKELQYPMAITENEKTDIIAFLLTLTDRDFLFNPRYKNQQD